MLILRRKAGETISIGEDVRVVIVDIQGNQVKLGIDAPEDVCIYREELLLKIRMENKKASDMRTDAFQADSLHKMFQKIQGQKEETGIEAQMRHTVLRDTKNDDGDRES